MARAALGLAVRRNWVRSAKRVLGMQGLRIERVCWERVVLCGAVAGQVGLVFRMTFLLRFLLMVGRPGVRLVSGLLARQQGMIAPQT
jgi:hypothetical protein